MSSQTLMITKAQYKDLKEYWDYQRVLEFNKESLKRRLEKVKGRVFDINGPIENLDTLFEEIWAKVSSDELETPFKGWIPLDPKWRFEWEPDPNAPKQLEQPKGRPVVLRARNYNEDNII